MAVEVEFVTLGDASKKLGVPAPTLRLWTDELEKNEVHFVLRNHRDERIYHDNDLEIFEYMRDLKKEHGRKAQTKDIALMIYQQALENDMFDLRTKEEVPKPKPSNTALNLLNNEDVQRLLESDRVKQLLGHMVSEATKQIKEDLIVEVRQSIRNEMLNGQVSIENLMKEDEARRLEAEEERVKKEEERIAKMDEVLRERDERSMKLLEELQKSKKELEEKEAEKPKSWWQKIKG